MARFVEGSSLHDAMEKVIQDATNYLYLVSPSIKLNEKIKDQLRLKRAGDDLKIVVVYSKSEGEESQLAHRDLEFFNEFPNLEVRRASKLYVVGYASDAGTLITSVNLYDFSPNNNNGAGIFLQTPRSLFGRLTNLGDARIRKDVMSFFDGIVAKSDLVFKRDSGSRAAVVGGPGLTRGQSPAQSKLSRSRRDFPRSKSRDSKAEQKGEQMHQMAPATGYCIRTGVAIPFNTNKPFSLQAFQEWAEYSKVYHPENFCHYSGEPSYGKTSKRKPVLFKNLMAAQKMSKR